MQMCSGEAEALRAWAGRGEAARDAVSTLKFTVVLAEGGISVSNIHC